MYRVLRPSPKTRVLSSRLGSVLLLFQRSPVVQILFPEARILGGAGLGELTKWTIATVAGLGAYDTVAGATTITQLAPNAGAATVPATSGTSLSFIFQVTGAPSTAGSWTVTGTLPAGLTHSNAKNNSVDSITGTPTQTGSFPITVKAWENSNFSGGSSTKAFTINVVAGAVVAPTITTQPGSSTINSGGTATLTVAASGTSPSFQWYRGSSGVIANPVSGATSASFTTPSLTANTTYWARASNSSGTDDSNAATITVRIPPVITSQPASATINSGGTTTLTVAASGTSPTFQWYAGASGVITNPVAGATSASFTTPALTTNTSYWARATNAAGTANSNAAAVTIRIAPAITTQPVAATINSGSTATFTVAVSGTSPTFQWYEGNSGVTANPVSGATGLAFTTPPLTTTTGYWFRATNAAGTADSNIVTATVITPPAITSQPASSTLDSGGTATLTVSASGSSPTFQWYAGVSGNIANPVSGATNESFTTPPLTQTISYWARATNAAGTADSNAATVTVSDPFVTWQQFQFSAENLANPQISGATADPDGDGITNSEEYIFGLLPLAADPSPSPVSAIPGSQISLSFTAKAATGAGYAGLTRHYAIEAADGFAPATWAAVDGFSDIIGNNQPVTYNAPVTGSRKFYRLSVYLKP